MRSSNTFKKITHYGQVRFIPGMQGWYNIHKSINFIYHINNIKDKNHRIISVDARRVFDKVQHPLMIQTFSIMGIEGTYFNIIKAISEKSTQTS